MLILAGERLPRRIWGQRRFSRSIVGSSRLRGDRAAAHPDSARTGVWRPSLNVDPCGRSGFRMAMSARGRSSLAAADRPARRPREWRRPPPEPRCAGRTTARSPRRTLWTRRTRRLAGAWPRWWCVRRARLNVFRLACSPELVPPRSRAAVRATITTPCGRDASARRLGGVWGASRSGRQGGGAHQLRKRGGPGGPDRTPPRSRAARTPARHLLPARSTVNRMTPAPTGAESAYPAARSGEGGEPQPGQCEGHESHAGQATGRQRALPPHREQLAGRRATRPQRAAPN
jgi:hypothetical protein